MTQLPVIIVFALVLAIPLTLIVSSVVLVLYRRALLLGMGRLPPPSAKAMPAAAVAPEWRAALTGVPGDALQPTPFAPMPSYRQLRSRESRFWGALSLLWLLIGLSGAVPYLLLNGQPLSPLRILGVGMAWASLGWMALGLIARLPWRRGVGLILACVLIPGLVIWFSFKDQSAAAAGQLVAWLLPLQGIPLTALILLMGVPALRATAPLLYPPVLLITLLAMVGQGALVALNALGASPHLLRLLPTADDLISGCSGIQTPSFRTAFHPGADESCPGATGPWSSPERRRQCGALPARREPGAPGESQSWPPCLLAPAM